MIFVPKTIIIFKLLLGYFFWVLYVVKLKLAFGNVCLPDSGKYFLLVFQNACPDCNFHLPRAIGQALMSHPDILFKSIIIL